MTYINHLPEDQRIKELERLYRAVFSTPEGKIVFTAMLEDLGYFDTLGSEHAHILRDFATKLAGKGFSGDSFALVEAMLNVQKIDRVESGQEQ